MDSSRNPPYWTTQTHSFLLTTHHSRCLKLDFIDPCPFLQPSQIEAITTTSEFTHKKLERKSTYLCLQQKTVVADSYVQSRKLHLNSKSVLRYSILDTCFQSTSNMRSALRVLVLHSSLVYNQPHRTTHASSSPPCTSNSQSSSFRYVAPVIWNNLTVPLRLLPPSSPFMFDRFTSPLLAVLFRH